MSAPAFTPGPWTVCADPAFVDAPDGRLIADCTDFPRARRDAVEANARLIAAAPELLEAAETVLAGLNARIDAAPRNSVPVFAGIAALSDAINKARGNQ